MSTEAEVLVAHEGNNSTKSSLGINPVDWSMKNACVRVCVRIHVCACLRVQVHLCVHVLVHIHIRGHPKREH